MLTILVFLGLPYRRIRSGLKTLIIDFYENFDLPGSNYSTGFALTVHDTNFCWFRLTCWP